MKFPLALILSLAGLTWHANAYALACGDSITQDTTLTGDLSCTSGGYALHVATSGVTIDFNGYTVSGTETMDGVRVANASDVSLLHGNLTGFRVGVNASQADKLTVGGMLMYELGSAVIASNSRAVTLVGNAAHSFERWGFFLPAYRGNRRFLGGHTIAGNRLDGSPTLIGVCGYANSGNIIRGNDLHGGGMYLFDGAARNEVTGNAMEARSTFDPGIVLLGSRQNMVRDNTVFLYSRGISLIPAYTGTCQTGPLPLPQVDHNQIISNDIIIGQTAILLGRGDRRLPLVFANSFRDNIIAAFDLGLHLRADTFCNEATGNEFFNTLLSVRDEGFLNRITDTASPIRSGPARVSVKPSAGALSSAADSRTHVAKSRPHGMNRNPPRSTLKPRSRAQ